MTITKEEELSKMITYSYKCYNCGSQYEIRQSIKDKPVRYCENCDKKALKRLINNANGIILKAEGFTRKVI